MYSEKPKLHEREKNRKQPGLKSLVLDVTNKCNMKCSFCYAEPFAKTEPVDLVVLKKALDEAYDMGVSHICLMGGEVCADYERLKAIIPLTHPDETYLNIVSNGWGMSKERISELRHMWIDKITFSVDSGIEKEHDKSRMPGSFKRIMEAIDNVKAEGLQAGISTVVTHTSLYSEGFKKAYDIAKEKGIRFDVQIVEPVGKLDGIQDDLITKEDADYIYKLYEASPIVDDGRKMIKRDLYRNGVSCPAGKEFMSISADGNFLPCNFLQASLGNIKDRSLKEMREDLLKSKWFSEEHAYCLMGECKQFFDEFVYPNKDKKKPLDAYKLFCLK